MKCILCNKVSKSRLCAKHRRTHTVDQELSLGSDKWIRKKQGKGVRWKTQRSYFNWAKKVDTTSKEEVFPPWTHSQKGVRLEFDICLPKYRILIEIQGPGHYKYVKYFHKAHKDFTEQKARDRIKLRQAIGAGWHVVWIPTDEFMSKEDFGAFVVGITDENPRLWEWPEDRELVLGDKPPYNKIRTRRRNQR